MFKVRPFLIFFEHCNFKISRILISFQLKSKHFRKFNLPLFLQRLLAELDSSAASSTRARTLLFENFQVGATTVGLREIADFLCRQFEHPFEQKNTQTESSLNTPPSSPHPHSANSLTVGASLGENVDSSPSCFFGYPNRLPGWCRVAMHHLRHALDFSLSVAPAMRIRNARMALKYVISKRAAF